MQRKITIKYNWRRDDDKKIPKKHIEALEEDAEKHIFEMLKDDYTSGELCTSVRFGKDIVPQEDEDDGLSYTGWWSVNQKNID